MLRFEVMQERASLILIAVIRTQTKLDFKQAELHALETRCRDQVITELKEVQGVIASISVTC